eukprot:1340516-Amorphochlora_amoeboformis.AAC.3
MYDIQEDSDDGHSGYGPAALVRKDETMDTSWLKNDTADGVEKLPTAVEVSSEDSSPSSDRMDEKVLSRKTSKKKSRKRKKREKSSSSKPKKRKKMLTDREKIKQIEQKLTKIEKNKQTRSLRLYYWGNDFDVDVDVRKQKTIWAEDSSKKVFIDRMGNNDNLVYKQLYRLDVPNYKNIHEFFLGGEGLPKYMVRNEDITRLHPTHYR